MITLTNVEDSAGYGVREYVLDTADDLEKLTAADPAGSTAFVIETGKVYMKTSGKYWKEI